MSLGEALLRALWGAERALVSRVSVGGGGGGGCEEEETGGHNSHNTHTHSPLLSCVETTVF